MALSPALKTLMKLAGASDADIAAADAAGTSTSTKTKKPPKSGVFERTQESQNIPTDAAIEEQLNKKYQQFYGRDATQDELVAYLPMAKAQYQDPKTGQSKSYIKETYKNGRLVDTQVLTKDKKDIGLFLENVIKSDLLQGKVAVNPLNIPEGPMGKTFIGLKQLARENGVSLSDEAALDYANKVAAEQIDDATAQNNIREMAASAFPQFGDKIKAGVNLKTLADPYIQSMSNILELPSSNIDLFDPTVRGALSYTGQDGKPASKSLYDFEQQLRNDPRWTKTSNARQAMDNVGLQVLRNFGLAN